MVEDVRTGEILASASYPTYSLPDFRKDYNNLLADPLKPLNNRAFNGLYPPGSTFKMISAIAGLETGIITLHHHPGRGAVYLLAHAPAEVLDLPPVWAYPRTGQCVRRH